MNAPGKMALLDKPKTVFAVAAYEDQATRDQLIQSSNRLTAQFNGELEFNFSWWCFDYLQDPGLAAFAANEAILADIVIVSTQKGGELPVNIQRWLNLWAAQKQNHPSALVGLMGASDDQDCSPGDRFLRDIAARSGMDYLPQLSLAALSSHNKLVEPVVVGQPESENFMPYHEERVRFHPSCSHWGINE